MDDLRTATPAELFNALADRGYEGAAAVERLLTRYLVPPSGRSLGEFRSCVRFGSDCGEPVSFDPAGFVDAMNETLLVPRATAQGWLDTHPYLTRLYTELSGPEMTLDPEFVYDAGLGDLSNLHSATTVTECSAAYFLEDAPVHVDYDTGGRSIVREGVIADATTYCARRGGWLPGARPGPDAPSAGGCNVGGRATAPLALLLLALLGLRRKR